jgi:hypothetical protein
MVMISTTSKAVRILEERGARSRKEQERAENMENAKVSSSKY